MKFLPEIFDKHAKYKPWLGEKYGDTFDDKKNRKKRAENEKELKYKNCLLYTSPSPRDVEESRMPSSA